MLGKKLILRSAAGMAALAAAWGLGPATASADDARLTVKPAIYQVQEGSASNASVQPVRYGYYGGRGYGWGGGWRGGWGGGYRGYGWRGNYRPFYGRSFYGGYGYPGYGYGYGYPAYGYGYGYPGYGSGGFYGGGVW